MINPYKDIAGLSTFKGDLHFHSSESDGKALPEEMFDRLSEQGFAFCCLADHDIPRQKTCFHSKLMILPGQEMSSEFGHIVSLFSQVKREESWSIKEQLQAARNSGGFTILSHPQIREFIAEQDLAYNSKRLLCEFPELYDGIEIYTHNVGSGFKLALDRLDTIWSSYVFTYGALYDKPFSPVWGFASSDGHQVSHITNNVGIVVWTKDLTENNIREALKAGTFYSLANSCARFTEILEDKGEFHVSAKNVVMLKVIMAGGMVAKIECTDKNGIGSIAYSINGTEGYIRFEAIDSNGRAAYTNPIFVGKHHG